MFSTIFIFEIKRWLKSPAFYVYCYVFFLISILIMASALGVFDGATATTSSPSKVNSPYSINSFLSGLSSFVYFLLPTIIGASVYRDFKYNMHHVLFSYPLKKANYLFAKFFSALVITIAVVLTIIIGFVAAQFLPGVREDLLGPQNVWAYFQAMILLIIPNLILFGAIVFCLVTFTRNIYIGFIFVLMLFVFQEVVSMLTRDMDNRYVAALLDPFGFEALEYTVKYWTVDERNNRNLPFEGIVLHNRLVWLGVSALIMSFVYFTFSFSQLPFAFRKSQKSERSTKDNFGSIIPVNLSQVTYDFSFWTRIKTAWNLSNYDFVFIIRNWVFIIILLITTLFLFVVMSVSSQILGTETYPMTWKMLGTVGGLYGFFLQILIFLFAGILMKRSQNDRMNLLIDATAIPNWVLLLTKIIALVKMVLLVLAISILTSVCYQAFQGYYNFELDVYIKELFGLDMLKYLTLILFALLIHSFFKNYIAGFMLCIGVMFLIPLLSRIGIEQDLFKFNRGPGYSYSDMNGYGALRDYIIYRIYWLLFGLVLISMALLLWQRGVATSMKEKFKLINKRFVPQVYVPLIIFLLSFVSLGAAIYYHDNISEKRYSSKQIEQQQVDYEVNYKKYGKIPQPRIVATKVAMDIYPEARSYKANVIYDLQNKTEYPIDTLFINYSDELNNVHLNKASTLFLKDTILKVQVFVLQQPILSGEIFQMTSVLESKPNTFLKDKSSILENGTFINNSLFPSIGYSQQYELVDNVVRTMYKLPNRDRMAEPTDSLALRNNYISSDADWINFEATVSTSADQIAIAPGYLLKKWESEGRNYYHYKMDQKMLNFYSFNSGKYEMKKEKWQGIDLEIYYHTGHEFNLDRMMNSMKNSFTYFQKEFSPYQFTQMRIIEFPNTYGTFAQSFANTVPFSESIGFIARVDDEKEGVDYAYNVTAHELSHQWWAHQVIGANVKGATMLSESLAEYSALKVLEQTYGKIQMRKYLKEALNSYLTGRTAERIKENPLMYNENQQFIHYNKGSLVMYAMSDFLGEANFNNFLKKYIQTVGFQEPPYTTSIEFVNLLKQETPDSLHYVIKDMFETITLYDNAITNVTSKKLAENKYEVVIDFNVSKYRSGTMGKKSFEDKLGSVLKLAVKGDTIHSLPLSDYIEIGVYSEPKKNKAKMLVDNELYLKKIRVDKINNRLKIVVKQKPFEVAVDPYHKLIDTDADDNVKQL